MKLNHKLLDGYLDLMIFDEGHRLKNKSIKTFWQKWHVSVSSWFKDYLYIPLGGNKHGNFRTALNLLIVFILCVLYH